MFTYEEFFITNFLYLHIKKKIYFYKHLCFSDYMYLCLYTFKYGYYENDLEKFGLLGDYTTAPEMGRLFVLCIGRQLKQIEFFLKKIHIIEIGAGSGLLARDLILFLNSVNISFSCYLIYEKSTFLRFKQRSLLADLCSFCNIKWIATSLFFFNCAVFGFVLLNEVFDAFPVDFFYIKNFVFYEQYVIYSKNFYFYFYFFKPTNLLKYFFFDIYFFLNRKCIYVSELHFSYFLFLYFLNIIIKIGYIFIFDYGTCLKDFFISSRSAGTLRVYEKHCMHYSFFQNFGLVDITSNVNFTFLLYFAKFLFTFCFFYLIFSSFLFKCGLVYILKKKLKHNFFSKFLLINEVKNLVLTDEMGTIFKTVILKRKLMLKLLCQYSIGLIIYFS